LRLAPWTLQGNYCNILLAGLWVANDDLPLPRVGKLKT
jgi:hypothetical protein